ncbi:MAG: metallophosphoesterase, partial [Raoultibacter sp.]
MPKRVTFIHAADLHFGAPFRGLRALSETWALRLLTAIPESYVRVIDAALDNQVDFVIIAGDIFDSSRASYADYLAFFEGLHRLNDAGI